MSSLTDSVPMTLDHTVSRLIETISSLQDAMNHYIYESLGPTTGIVDKWTALNLHTWSSEKAVLKYAMEILPLLLFFKNRLPKMKAEFISLTILYGNTETDEASKTFETLYLDAIKELNSIFSLTGVRFKEFKNRLRLIIFKINSLVEFTNQFLLRLLYDIVSQ